MKRVDVDRMRKYAAESDPEPWRAPADLSPFVQAMHDMSRVLAEVQVRGPHVPLFRP